MLYYNVVVNCIVVCNNYKLRYSKQIVLFGSMQVLKKHLILFQTFCLSNNWLFFIYKTKHETLISVYILSKLYGIENTFLKAGNKFSHIFRKKFVFGISWKYFSLLTLNIRVGKNIEILSQWFLQNIYIYIYIYIYQNIYHKYFSLPDINKWVIGIAFNIKRHKDSYKTSIDRFNINWDAFIPTGFLSVRAILCHENFSNLSNFSDENWACIACLDVQANTASTSKS